MQRRVGSPKCSPPPTPIPPLAVYRRLRGIVRCRLRSAESGVGQSVSTAVELAKVPAPDTRRPPRGVRDCRPVARSPIPSPDHRQATKSREVKNAKRNLLRSTETPLPNTENRPSQPRADRRATTRETYFSRRFSPLCAAECRRPRRSEVGHALLAPPPQVAYPSPMDRCAPQALAAHRHHHPHHAHRAVWGDVLARAGD